MYSKDYPRFGFGFDRDDWKRCRHHRRHHWGGYGRWDWDDDDDYGDGCHGGRFHPF